MVTHSLAPPLVRTVNGHAPPHIFRLEDTQDEDYLVKGIKEGLTATDNHHLQRRSSTNQCTKGDHERRCRKFTVNQSRN